MNNIITNQRIRVILEEDRRTFGMLNDAGGHPNMDYAGYVAYASLKDFRNALENKDLSPEQLAALLRKAYHHVQRKQAQSHKKQQCSDWGVFMASYVTTNANSNRAAGV